MTCSHLPLLPSPLAIAEPAVVQVDSGSMAEFATGLRWVPSATATRWQTRFISTIDVDGNRAMLGSRWRRATGVAGRPSAL